MLRMQLRQELHTAFPVPEVGGQDLDVKQQAQSADDQVALAAFDLLASAVPFDPPFPRS